MAPPLLHIGFHKTGTTWLQDHVFGDADKGYAMLWSRDGTEIARFVLPHPCRFDPATTRADFERAARGLAAGMVPVISGEGLSGKPVAGRFDGVWTARRLAATFPEAKVIIGIREQKAMLRSFWSQYVRQDGEWPLASFIGRGDEPAGFQPVFRLDHLEYDLMVGEYVRLLGRENVLVLPMEWLRRDPAGYENAVHAFAGTGAVAGAAGERVNIGHGAMTLAIARRLNRIWKRPPVWTGGDGAIPLGYRIKRRLLGLMDRFLPRAVQARQDRIYKARIAARVAAVYGPSNRRLAALTGLDLAGFGYDMGDGPAGQS